MAFLFRRGHCADPRWHLLSLCLQIRGTDKSNGRELHIAYRYGEHYDSVRRINDNSEAPARLQTEVSEAAASLCALSPAGTGSAGLCAVSPAGTGLGAPCPGAKSQSRFERKLPLRICGLVFFFFFVNCSFG